MTVLCMKGVLFVFESSEQFCLQVASVCTLKLKAHEEKGRKVHVGLFLLGKSCNAIRPLQLQLTSCNNNMCKDYQYEKET